MQEKRDIDYPLLFAVLALVIFGAIVISSVSVYDSHRITRKLVESGLLEEPNNWRFMVRNLMQAGLGLFGLVLAIKTPYQWWKKNIKILSIIVTAMLVLVLIFGVKINGARGWFDVPGLPFSLQPTEFLKLTMILSVSVFCAQYKNFLGSIAGGFVPFLGIIIVPILLVLLQPDLGSLVIILPIVIGIYFIAGGNVKILFYCGFAALILSSFLYIVGRYDTAVPESRNQFSYIYDRMNTFIQPNKTAIEENTMHHQNKQALIAIGSGGFLGLGFGKSVQKYGYLPEPQGDFIFSIITEEWGFIGAFVIICLYTFIIVRGFIIASLCEDQFGKYVAFGITTWLSWQMILNMSVNMNIFPNTGLTLPFLSYGGSSLLTMLVAIGILLSISRDIDAKKKHIKNLVSNFILRSTGHGSRKLNS